MSLGYSFRFLILSTFKFNCYLEKKMQRVVKILQFSKPTQLLLKFVHFLKHALNISQGISFTVQELSHIHFVLIGGNLLLAALT
jgi:hypothetical protein